MEKNKLKKELNNKLNNELKKNYEQYWIKRKKKSRIYPVVIKLNFEEKKALLKKCNKENKTISEFIRNALLSYLNKKI